MRCGSFGFYILSGISPPKSPTTTRIIMKIFYKIPLSTTSGTINLLITQGRIKDGFVLISSFGSKVGYIFWNIIITDEERKLFSLKEIKIGIKNAKKAIDVVRNRPVHSTSSVEILEVPDEC